MKKFGSWSDITIFLCKIIESFIVGPIEEELKFVSWKNLHLILN